MSFLAAGSAPTILVNMNLSYMQARTDHDINTITFERHARRSSQL